MRGYGDVASANLQDSNHHKLARAPRRGLRGQSPQVHPTTFASRAVRRIPASCRAVPRFFSPLSSGSVPVPLSTQ